MTTSSTAPPAELMGRSAMERLADAALTAAMGAGAADVEAVVQREWGGLTRFANSQIHQNVWTEDVWVNVRVVTSDHRVGVASTHASDPALVAAAATQALALARLVPPDAEFPGFAPAAATPEVPFDEATAAASPADRAASVRALLAEVPDDIDASGAFRTGGIELAVVTTAGQRAYAPVSSAELTLVVSAATSSGYAEAGGRTLGEVEPVQAAVQAVGKARAGADPVEVAAGRWPVILEPAATGALVQFLAYLGFGARDHMEGRSFTAGRMGQRVVDEQVTITDDGPAPHTIGFPFDYEGTPKQRVDLLRAGVVNGLVHDRWSAAKSGTQSTGHGWPAPNPHGPASANPIMRPGAAGSVADLVRGRERALLVTRFHYTNVQHQLETRITGMTRDGTFLVEDGVIRHGVRNLRFTDSIVRALERVDAVSTETGYASELFFGGSRFPALALPDFTFTGTTSFG